MTRTADFLGTVINNIEYKHNVKLRPRVEQINLSVLDTTKEPNP